MFFISVLTVKKLLTSLCIHSSPKFFDHLYHHYPEFFLVKLYICFILPSSGTCFSFCLFLQKWPSLGNILCILAVQSPLISYAICSRHSPQEVGVGPWLWQAGYVGSLVSLVSSFYGWVPCLAWFTGCQLLVGGALSLGNLFQDPRGCKASAGSLVSRAKVQKIGAVAYPLVMGFMPFPG